jgi:SAM-dependent methyltransferase
MPWKWEHKETSGLISNGMKILEIGCASGNFLQTINNQFDVEVAGLELNAAAVEKAVAKGLNVHLQSVEEFSVNNIERFDLVCSFEVLEHIADVHSFLSASVCCLKKGGKLVVAVPNNDSFIKYNSGTNSLNMPPHHMGLWNYNSLRKIEDYFAVKFDMVKYEPLQVYHQKWYYETLNRHSEMILKKYRITIFLNKITPLLFRIARKLLTMIFTKIVTKNGHTVLVVYTKK